VSARVVRGDAPDLYHVQHATDPGMLSVKTMADSRALTALFRDAPCVTMRVRRGSSGEWLQCVS
jgi:hypothetical protein